MKTNLLRTTVLSCVLSLVSCISLQAQWVSIPDTNFGKWLNTTYVGCMQGNSQAGWQMDTSCPAVVNAATANCSSKSIINLTGIQYFDNLVILNCSNNNIGTVLPDLPGNLISLDCRNNQLYFLPSSLPNGLTTLYCSRNRISSSLIGLPSGLRTFDCSYNDLTSLPAIPVNLGILDCSNNQLTALPNLPNGVMT
ncbi:MAG: hypothetical protein V4615_16190, partial [Bacteroidota bacterium]